MSQRIEENSYGDLCVVTYSDANEYLSSREIRDAADVPVELLDEYEDMLRDQEECMEYARECRATSRDAWNDSRGRL